MDIEKEIEKYPLQNAVKYNGKASAGAVIGPLLARNPRLRSKAKELGADVARVVKGVNRLSKEQQKKRLRELAPGLLKGKPKEKGIQLQIGPEPVPARMRSASRLLSRALRELVANAVKFTASGSVIVDLRLEEGRVAFRVADSGSGLSAGSLQKLKDALGPQDTYEGLGLDLGLGLALSREAASVLGGRIEVESQPDRGSTFALVVELTKDNLEL